MIQPLRRTHAIGMAVLAVSLPVAVLLALNSRPDSRPARTGFPAAVQPSLQGFERVGSTEALLGETRAELKLYESAGPSRLAVEVIPRSSFETPDLLVYWTPDGSASGATVPGEAVLLGTLAGHETGTFILPAEAVSLGGKLLFYSPALGRRLAFEWVLDGAANRRDDRS